MPHERVRSKQSKSRAGANPLEFSFRELKKPSHEFDEFHENGGKTARKRKPIREIRVIRGRLFRRQGRRLRVVARYG